MTFRFLTAVLSIAVCLPAFASPVEGPDDGTHLATSSKEFQDSYQAAMSKLAGTNFESTLSSPSFGAMASKDVADLTKTIKAERPLPGVSVGDASVAYDVILQPGHYGRKKGRTGASGAKVSERALNAYFTGEIAAQLSATGLKVLVVPADGSKKGLKTKIFLAIHADGSAASCSAGPSLAYEKTADLFPMHAIGQGLAHAFGYSYEDFRKDNYTVNESKYYMFHRVNASMLKGLLEVGEVTCARSENRLLSSSKEISHNVASALSFLAHLQAGE